MVKTQTRSTIDLRMQHTSLQHGDTSAQQEEDVRDLFRQGTSYPIKTGTEASKNGGRNHNFYALKRQAATYGHYLHIVRDNWIAVDRTIVKPGTLSKKELFLVNRREMVGDGHDRVLCIVEFDHVNPGVGHVTVGAIHYATKSSRPTSPNWDVNKTIANKLVDWMASAGAGSDLVFLNGDFNMSDADPRQDWAFGGPFTSMADQLNQHQNTGHGPIDGFCSYDLDGRVKPKSFTVLDDREMFQHSDHFVCRGVWQVRLRKDT